MILQDGPTEGTLKADSVRHPKPRRFEQKLSAGAHRKAHAAVGAPKRRHRLTFPR